VKELNI
jgi:hypothetical protein